MSTTNLGVECGNCGGPLYMATCTSFRGTGHAWVNMTSGTISPLIPRADTDDCSAATKAALRDIDKWPEANR